MQVFDYKPSDLAKSDNGPRAFAESSVYDFGEVHAGSKVRHTFKLRNLGKADLKILKTKQSCSCTATILSKNHIPPGEYGLIETILDVPSENRNVKESIRVYTNDPMLTEVAFTLKGVAFMPITTLPNRIGFGQVVLGTVKQKTLTVHRRRDKDVQITGIRISSPHLTAKMVTEGDEEIMSVVISLLKSMPPNLFHAKFFIDYIYEGQKATLEVPIQGQVLGEFIARPQSLFWGLIKSDETASKTVTISSINARSFEIVGVESNSEHVTAKISACPDEVGYELTVTVHPEVPVGELFGDILVKTDNVNQPTIRVPFSGIIADKK